MTESEQVLKEVAAQVAVCKSCQLNLSRKKAVPGEGPPDAQIVLIGEGPGFYENEQGRPFVGAAGKFLDELLEKAGVKRSEVFITNVVKCRPPGNRDPEPAELQACSGYLDRQIEAINPLIIVTLGRYSMAKFLPNVKISDVHGKPAWVRGRLIVPMFHPAAALHQPSLKTSVERDFARLPEWIQQARQSGRPVEKAASVNQVAELEAPYHTETAPGKMQTQQGSWSQAHETPHQPELGSTLFDLDQIDPVEEEKKEDPKDGPVQLSLF